MGLWKETSRELFAKTNLFRIFKVGYRSVATGKEGKFDLFETNNWMNVVPVTGDGHVILVEQFRYGSGELSLEFPAGTIEAGQQPLDTAIRELREETGGEGRVSALGVCRPNPAVQSNFCYHFLAEGVEIKHPQSLDEHEEIRVLRYRLEEVDGLIVSGKISHSLSIVSWHLYQARKISEKS